MKLLQDREETVDSCWRQTIPVGVLERREEIRELGTHLALDGHSYSEEVNHEAKRVKSFGRKP